MRALILADLDNVLDGSFAGFASTAAQALERVKANVGDVVTVFAFNTSTALDLSFEELRAANRRFQDALGAQESHTEIALALTMPQTADVLLERLAREAPEVATSGPYGLAVLFTQDRDLADSLGGQPAWKGWYQRFYQGSAGRSWQRGPSGRAAIRKPPPPGRTTGGSEPSLEGVTIEVSDGDGVAAWASRRRLDVDPNATLKDLAQHAEREPWILSQIAAATGSVRGIARLNGLPTVDVPLLGPVSRRDGLEVLGRGSPTSSGCQPTDASVGIGAIRFREPGITVRTHLPRSVFDGDRRYTIGTGGVATQRVLQGFQPGQRISPASVRVEFRQRGGQVVVKVVQEPTRQPKLWWIGKDTKTTSELRFDGGDLVPESFEAVARAIRCDQDADYQVCLVADADGTSQVSVPRSIARGTLGRAALTSDPACEVAVLAMNASISAGAVVSATPIQQIRGSKGQHDFPKGLWSAPILVVR